MTTEEKQEIAVILGDVLAAHDRRCPNGIDADTASTLKSFADAVRSGKKTAYKAFITLAIGALCAAFLAGIREIFNK
jgi:hypothetical protein